MRPFRSLRTRLAASIGLLVLVIVALAGVVNVSQTDARDRAELDAQLQTRAELIGDDLGKVTTDRGASTDEYRALLAGSQSLVRVIVDGVVVAERGELPEGEILGPTVQGLSTIPVDGEKWRSVVVANDSGVDVQVLQNLAPVNQRLVAHAWLVASVAAVATLLAVAGGWVIASVILRPLRALTQGAQRIRDAHHIEDRMPRVSSPAEVADLSETLNDMLERLEHSANATRRFTADAGHELRTPLAGAAGALEIVQRNPGLTAVERRSLLDSAGADLGRATALLDGLQGLARGDALALPAREAVDVVDLAADAVRGAQRRHSSVRYELDDQAPPDSAPALVWRDGIRLAIDNLLDNAAFHGRENGHVALRVRANASSTTITVADDGPGIVPDQRSAMRARFARGKDARAPGSGLGLALVDQQAALHGGELILEQSESGGLAATLTLPTLSRTS